MKNLSNVQKKENLNKEATKANEVTLIGNNVELLFTNKRYSALKNLFEEMENNLKTPLNFDVNISCVMLEAFAKGIMEDDGLVELFQTNMAPKSFFCFVNDLSLARKHTSSREIINIYFTEKVIKKLNRFYNEYSDVFDFSQRFKYTTLPLFEVTGMNDTQILQTQFPNLFQYLHDENKSKRHIVSCLINEFNNELSRSISENSRNELFHQLSEIDKNIHLILENSSLDCLYTIENLYYSI